MKHLIQKVLQTKLIDNSLYRKAYWWNVNRLIPKLLNKPRRVIIENTNHCNLDCSFCPNQRMKRNKGTMSEELFKSIINQCVEERIEHVYIFGVGEPLLDSDYYDKVWYAKNMGIPDVHCVTNGILLKELPWVDYLGISVDATLGTKYEDVVLDNMKRVWKQRQSRDVIIEARFKEYGDFRKWRPYCNKIGVYINITNWGSEIKSQVPKGVQFPCSDLWSSLYIGWDGKVHLCCKDYECDVQIGDLKKDSLINIWHSPILQWYRANHKNGDYNYICEGCVSNTHLVNPWWRVEL